MNRIRETAEGYEVLTTPHRKYDVGFEFMLGSWTDEGLSGFKVYTYDNYADAECEALRHPDINWEQLHAFHKDQYNMFRSIVSKIVEHSAITCSVIPTLMTPIQIKNIMMDRVLKADTTNSFRLAYDMNDIITFVVTNPWSFNLKKLHTIFYNETRLNIFKSYEVNGIIHLVGRTDIGSTYEIILCPSIMYNWMQWKSENRGCGTDKMMSSMKRAIKAQRAVDQTEPVV